MLKKCKFPGCQSPATKESDYCYTHEREGLNRLILAIMTLDEKEEEGEKAK